MSRLRQPLYLAHDQVKEESEEAVKSTLDTYPYLRAISRFIWWIGGGIPHLLERYPTEQGKYYGIGGAIIFTCILAMISSYIALSVIVDDPLIKIPASVLWGLMILNLDRFITVSMKKRGNELDYVNTSERVYGVMREILPAIPRFIIAIIIGFLISIPLELRIFDDEVNQQLHEVQTREMARYEKNVESDKSQAFVDYQQKVNGYDADLNKLQDDLVSKTAFLDNEINQNILKRSQLQEKVDEFFERYIKEVEGDSKSGSGLPGEGKIALQKKGQWQEKKQAYQNEMDTLGKVINDLYQQKERLKDESSRQSQQLIQLRKSATSTYEGSVQRYEQTKQGFQENLSDGLLIRIKALFLLGDSDSTIQWSLYLFIAMIFLIESAPVLVKLMSYRGAYDAKIEELDYQQMFLSDRKTEQLKREARKEMYANQIDLS